MTFRNLLLSLGFAAALLADPLADAMSRRAPAAARSAALVRPGPAGRTTMHGAVPAATRRDIASAVWGAHSSWLNWRSWLTLSAAPKAAGRMARPGR